MSTIQAQLWKGSPFTIQREDGKTPNTVIFRLSGPFTARDMYGSLTPVALGKMLDFQSVTGSELPALNILDLTEVPYMDSAGLGIVVRHVVRCKSKGVRLVAAGVSSRVLELFKMTKVDAILPVIDTVEEADTQ